MYALAIPDDCSHYVADHHTTGMTLDISKQQRKTFRTECDGCLTSEIFRIKLGGSKELVILL